MLDQSNEQPRNLAGKIAGITGVEPQLGEKSPVQNVVTFTGHGQSI